MTTIDLDPAEVQVAAERLTRICVNSEVATTGHIRLTARGGLRRWYATDSRVAAHVEYPHEGPELDVLLSPRLFHPHVTETSCCRLQLPSQRPDGSYDGPARLQVDDLEVVQPVRHPTYPDLDRIMGDAASAPAATATVEVESLLRLVDVVARRPAGSDPELAPPAFLSIAPGEVSLRADWPGWGESRATIAAEDAAGQATAAVGPMVLLRLLEVCPSLVTLNVPVQRGVPVVLEAPGLFRGALMPLVWLDADALLAEVQELLADHFGLTGIAPDEDGDLPVPFEDARLYVRTVEGEDPGVQVFSVLAHVPSADPELLERLNDLNTSLRDCRTFWVDGQVLLESDLTSTELTAETLRSTLNVVADSTRMVRGLFSGEM